MAAAEKHLTTKHYVLTWMGLCCLTLLSFATSYAPLGAADLVISLGIAVAKTLLVLLVFMHLIEQSFINRVVVAVAFALIALLATLTAADVATRHTFPKAPHAQRPDEGDAR